MKRRHTLLYLGLMLAGISIGVESLMKMLNSPSLVTSLYELARMTWSLAFAGYAGSYWLFLRQHAATEPKQLPAFEMFKNGPWVSTKQERILNGLAYTSAIFAALSALSWLLSKLFF